MNESNNKYLLFTHIQWRTGEGFRHCLICTTPATLRTGETGERKKWVKSVNNFTASQRMRQLLKHLISIVREDDAFESQFHSAWDKSLSQRDRANKASSEWRKEKSVSTSPHRALCTFVSLESSSLVPFLLLSSTCEVFFLLSPLVAAHLVCSASKKGWSHSAPLFQRIHQ